MKENLENETVDAEKLLREKSWEQMSDAERKVATEVFADRAEYERMHAMVHQLRSSAGFTEEELEPSDSVRKNLLDAFDDEQRRRRVLWWNSLGFWFRDRVRLDIPAVRFAVAGVILFAGVFAVLRLLNSNGAQPAEFVEQKIPVQDSAPNVVSNDQTNTPVLPVDSFAVDQNLVPVIAPQEIISPKTVAVRPIAPVPSNKNVVPIDGFDTSATRLAMGTGNDTAVMPIAVNVFSSGSDPAVCCGAGIQLTAPISNNATYNWTPAFSLTSGTPMNATYVVVGQAAPTSRALVEDENLVSVFFSLR